MLITIEESAKEYILRKSEERAISISISQRPGGIHNHGEVKVANQIPAVQLGKTEKAVYYEQVEVDGFMVYYHPTVAELYGKLTVSLEKLFFMKKLIARATV
ncbi:CC/Se motif family (seleno)protein [Sporomusa sphaeroides]|uniref:CC/Se motif family (seleno)protein n=1 Tax=Sporomusa sphaeroides TaxID=47679 RepID=UPI002C0E65E1|nr:CC/Se motif family (seleno)protein [Sporomusa sphaeroides]HML32011.1 CC/Se motif family (seleno)protein [Sporomusa sphaeroides]